MENKQVKLSRQEEAYQFVTDLFLKLIQNDVRISPEYKKAVVAYWRDMFDHEGVRNNMIQAFSNFLFEIDGKMDSARKAGISQLKDAILQSVGEPEEGTVEYAIAKAVIGISDDLLKAESTPEEKPLTDKDIENMDLSEVGGGDEDDTPLI